MMSIIHRFLDTAAKLRVVLCNEKAGLGRSLP